MAVFAFAENKQGDAPMRVLIAARLNAEPAAARDPRSFCQFGPLPIEVIRSFLWLDPDGRRGSRWPSLLAGLAVFPWFYLLGRRMLTGDTPLAAVRGPEPSRLPSGSPSRSRSADLSAAGPSRQAAPGAASSALMLAALALAVSPLHIQASTTATSEALYLLLSVGAYERLAAGLARSTGRLRVLAVAGLLASLAAVTRFDAFIALPVAVLAVWWWGGRDRRALASAGVFGAVAAVFPAAYLLWSWRATGEAFFFARYIARDHAQLAAEVAARLGALGGRARQLGIWAISFAAVMTPTLVGSAIPALRAWRQQSLATRVILTSALSPFVSYLAKGLAFGDFEPLPRFAIAPGVVLLPVAALVLHAALRRRAPARLPRTAATRRAAVLILTGGLGMGGLAAILAFAPALSGKGRIWTGGESISPLTRLDAEDRAVAEFLRARRRPTEAVFIDTWGYADIVIAHAAGVPIGRVATLAITRTPSPTLAAARAATSASWFAYHDASWGKRLPPDWPQASTARFGHWRVARYPGY